MSAQRASQLVEAGLWLRLSGDHEGAKRLFEQALKLDPGNARARQLLDSPPAKPAGAEGAAKGASELDWGLATGKATTPPPVPQVPPVAPLRPQGAAPGTQTIRLGEASAPEIPEAPRFEDPHGEVMITGADDPPAPDNSTLVFGMSGVPVPPAVPSGVPQGGTMVFGSQGNQGKNAPPPVAPVGGSTLVFGSKAAAAPPSSAPAAGPGGGTLVFGSTDPGELEPPMSSPTMMFGKLGASPAVPQGSPGSTLTFGSVPPSIAPLTSPRQLGVVTEPGLPAFDVDDFPLPPSEQAQLDAEAPRPSPLPPEPGRSSRETLEFNFDDMVANEEPPPPGPIPSPPVPYDKEDGPQTAWDKSNPRIDITQIQPGEGGGFDIIAAGPTPTPNPRSPAQVKEEISTLLSGAKDLLNLDDHSGAMELIGKALELDPSEPAALKLKDRSERTLQAMYESKLGDLNQIPRVKLKDDEIIWLNLDHRAGFVLAQIDGSVSFEEVFAVSGMSRLDTGRILAQLVEEGVISRG